MIRQVMQATFVCLMLGCISLSAADTHSAAPTTTPFDLIQSSYLEGKLSLDERALLDIMAIKQPDQLPAAYRTTALADRALAGRCVTDVLTRILIQEWEQLSPPTQASIEEAMVRRSTAFTYDSPGGFFKLHYDISGIHAVPSADNDLSGIPDFVERIAVYMDTSLEVHRNLGYLDPPSDGGLGGDTLFDVYFEEMSYYGYAVPEGPGSYPWNDYYSHLVMHRDFIGFPPNDDPEGNPAGAAKATAAHEFHHCVQFAYDVNEPSWFMELDATYIEDIAFDHVNDNLNYLPNYFNSPQTSLMDQSIHMYASFIWGMYLAQKFDTSLLVAAWDGARYESIFNTLSDTIMARYGWTQDSAFADFTVWNYMTNTRDDGMHHQEAAAYPLMKIANTHATFPVAPQNPPGGPAGYASNYVQFLPGGQEGQLTITFNGFDNQQWAAFVVKSTAINEHTVEKLVLDPVTQEGTAVIGHVEDYESITLIGANLNEFTTSSIFVYSANLRDPYALSSKVVTDSAIFSGTERDLTYRVYNTSELDDVVNVTVSDNLGWAVIDTVDKFIAAGDSTDVSFTVVVPQATPLEVQSAVTFRAVSKSDSLVWDEQQIMATTVLQRGDVNFTGDINLTDLTLLVAFLFQEGDPPIPVEEAGDLNCSGTLNLTDLTHMVNMLFLSGPGVPCSPY